MEPTKILFFGVVQDGNELAVIGYGYPEVKPVTKPLPQRFPLGVKGMIDALAYASVLDASL